MTTQFFCHDPRGLCGPVSGWIVLDKKSVNVPMWFLMPGAGPHSDWGERRSNDD